MRPTARVPVVDALTRDPVRATSPTRRCRQRSTSGAVVFLRAAAAAAIAGAGSVTAPAIAIAAVLFILASGGTSVTMRVAVTAVMAISGRSSMKCRSSSAHSCRIGRVDGGARRHESLLAPVARALHHGRYFGAFQALEIGHLVVIVIFKRRGRKRT